MEWGKENMHEARLQRGAQQPQPVRPHAATASSRYQKRDVTLPPRSDRRRRPRAWLAGSALLFAAFAVWMVIPGIHMDRAENDDGSSDMPVAIAPLPPLRDADIFITVTPEDVTEGYLSEVVALDADEAPAAPADTMPDETGPATAAVQDAAAELSRLPAPAAGTPALATAAIPGAAVQQQARPAVAPGPVARHARPLPDHPAAPWTINLVSMSRVEDAERFSAMAAARGVSTRTARVEVNGRDYWRVFVPGYGSAAAAEADAEAIRSQLGLQDVWIARR